MNKKRGLAVSQWAPGILILLLAVGLTGCGPTPTPEPTAPPTPTPVPTSTPTSTPAPTSTPTLLPTPEAPVIQEPAGITVTVKTGEVRAVRASAQGAKGYRWELQGAGEISTTEGEIILYTAPERVAEGGAMALLIVAAYNDGGTSPQTSLIINVVPAPITVEGRVFTVEGRVCQYRGDFNSLGNRLFLGTADFKRLGLPIGARVAVSVTVTETRQVSDLILDHDDGMVKCGVRLNLPTRVALGVDGDVKDDDGVEIPVEDRPIRDFQITVESIPTPPSTSESFEIEGEVCEYREDFSKLGDRLFLRTAEFNYLDLPIGTRVMVSITVDGTSRQVSGLILDHDEDVATCAFRLNLGAREALGVGAGDVYDLLIETQP